MPGSWSDYLELRTGTAPPPSPEAGDVRVYADSGGDLRAVQSDGTDAGIGGGITDWGASSTAKFVGSGSPVGVVTPSGEGDLYVDETTPGLWQASGLTDSDWIEVGGTAFNGGTVTDALVVDRSAGANGDPTLVVKAETDSGNNSFESHASDGSTTVSIGPTGILTASDVRITQSAAYTGGLIVQAAPATGDGGFTFAVFDPSALPVVQVRNEGLVVSAHVAPDTSLMNPNELWIGLDATPGATKVLFKALDSGGTPRTGSISLT